MHSISNAEERFTAFSRPPATAKPLKDVQASLRTSGYTPSVVNVVSTQLFSEVASEDMISPSDIFLAEKLAQTLQPKYNDLQKETTYPAAQRAFKKTYGEKPIKGLKAAAERDEWWSVWVGKLLGFSSSYEKLNIQLKETARETAKSFVFFDNALQRLLPLGPTERNQYAMTLRKEGLDHLCGGEDPYGAKAVLREIIYQVLRIIEPYLPESIKPNVFRTVAEIEAINPTLQTFNAAITDYRALQKQRLACETSLKMIDEGSDPWTMIESPSSSSSDAPNTSDQLKNQEESQLQQQKLEKQEELKSLSKARDEFLHQLPKALSPLLVHICAFYQMLAADEIKPYQITNEELRDLHAFADLTMTGAAPNSSSFRTAHTVHDLTTREIQRRQDDLDALDASKTESKEDEDTGFMHVSIPVEVSLERALVEIREGTSDTAFDVARRRFDGNDARTEAITLLKERQERVIKGNDTPAIFDIASRDLLLQLQVMDLSPVHSAWEYLFTFEGGQKDDTKATQQIANLNTTIQRLDESIGLYRTSIDTLRKQLADVAEPSITSSSLAEAVTSSIIDPIIAMTEMVTGPQTRLSLEKEIIKQERAIASCEKSLLQANVQKETWASIIEDIKTGSPFLKRLALYNECVQRVEKERLALLAAGEKPDDSRNGIEMVSMGTTGSTF